MTKFTLDEISAVDRPAQRGARALILKRDDADDPLDHALRKRGLLTSEEDGHAHLIVTDVVVEGGQTRAALHGETSVADGHAHPWIWTGDGIVVGSANGHDHGVAAVGVTLDELREAARARATRGDRAAPPDERVPDAEAAEKIEKERAEMLTREVAKSAEMVRGYDDVLADAARAFAKEGEDFYDAYHRLAHEHSPEGDAFRKTLGHRDDAQRLAAEKVGATYRSNAPALAPGNGAVRKNGQFAKVADVDAELDAAARRCALPGEPHLDAYCRLMGETSPSGDEFRGLIEKRDEAYRRAVG